MAFNPRSDVILEVLKAADPARASLAAERLNALGGANAPGGDFAADLDKAASAAPAPGAMQADGLPDARSRLSAMPDATDKAARAKVEFEATLLNSFVGELLPKGTSVFGEGTAGDMWRSMLSEQISKQIAKSGALGLSRRLFATHDLVPSRHAEAATAAGGAAEMSANILSAPSTATIDKGAVMFAGRKRT